jgi:hypothetical protein
MKKVYIMKRRVQYFRFGRSKAAPYELVVLVVLVEKVFN